MVTVPIPTPASVGALIRDRRRARGLDQADLAALVGVSRLWVNQIERGKPGASLGLVLRALAALGVTVAGHIDDGAPGRDEPSTIAPILTPDINAIVANARRRDRS